MPSLAARAGDFSAICHTGFDPNGFCNDTDSKGAQINQLFNVFLNQPYPYNQFDMSSVPAITQNLLGYFPAPNNGTNVYTATQVVHQDTNQFGLRLDQYIGGSDILNFRYAFSDGTELHQSRPRERACISRWSRAAGRNSSLGKRTPFSVDDRRFSLLLLAE